MCALMSTLPWHLDPHCKRLCRTQVDAELAEGGDVELGSGNLISAPSRQGPASRPANVRWLPTLRRISQEDGEDRAGADTLHMHAHVFPPRPSEASTCRLFAPHYWLL